MVLLQACQLTNGWGGVLFPTCGSFCVQSSQCAGNFLLPEVNCGSLSVRRFFWQYVQSEVKQKTPLWGQI